MDIFECHVGFEIKVDNIYIRGKTGLYICTLSEKILYFSVSDITASICWFSSPMLRDGPIMVHYTVSKEAAGNSTKTSIILT